MRHVTFTFEEVTGLKRITGDDAVQIVFRVDHASMLAGVKLNGALLAEGDTVLAIPAGFTDARIVQTFDLVVPAGFGISCKVIKTFIK